MAGRRFVATPAAKRVWDFSRDGVRRSLEESLERLGLDRVDVALVHDPDNHEREAPSRPSPRWPSSATREWSGPSRPA